MKIHTFTSTASRTILLIALFAALALHAPAQNQTVTANPPAAPAQAPQANAADVASVDSTLTALYDVISGPAGKKRDWNRLRSLLIPEARMIPIVPRKTGGFAPRVLTVEDYIRTSGNYLETNGFFEREVSRKEERYGNLVHAFSSYEARHKADDAQPFARGVNSIQLMFDGTRWWIMTIAWDSERPADKK